jgi:hypothetical protein
MNFSNDYVQSIIEMNQNLRSQLELLYKLLRTKLKMEDNTKLENILNEFEILKSSLSFSMLNHSNLVSIRFSLKKI